MAHATLSAKTHFENCPVLGVQVTASSNYGKYYLVQLNVATRSLEEDGFSGFNVKLASNALVMASQQIVDAQSTKERLDHYFASFDVAAALRDIQSKYERILEGFQVAKGSTYDEIFKMEADSNAANLKRQSSDAVGYQKQLPDLIARYESSLSSLSVRLKPFLDQTNAEVTQKADRKSSYRDHIEKVIRQDSKLADRCFGDDNDMVVVEPPDCDGGLLSVTIRLIIYPFSEASVANVHVYDENGQHLGFPVARRLAVAVVDREGKWWWMDCQRFDRSPREGEVATGREYVISQSFAADKLPTQGKLKLVITGKNVSVNYAADYRVTGDKRTLHDPLNMASLPQSVTTSTKTIRCRRAGNHLWVPVEIGSGSLMQQTELLLDTGASITCIPADIYEKLGRGNASRGKIQLETANGLISADTDVLPVKTSAFQRDICVAFHSSNKLLGANYFADCIFTVDVNNECIYVKRNGVQTDGYEPLTDGKEHALGE